MAETSGIRLRNLFQTPHDFILSSVRISLWVGPALGRDFKRSQLSDDKLAMLAESRKHQAVALLRTIPQMGPIRSALIVAILDTPHRFRTRRQLWSYSGLAVVTHMSSEYEIKDHRVVRTRKPIATRGLNRNCNRVLKDVFIGAATGGGQREPYRQYLEGLQNRGMRKEMARLTLARKISSIALTIWKKGEAFDPKKLNWAT
jgi:transposase